MRTKIFAIWDCKAEAFNAPFYFQHEAQAIRGFTDAVNDINSMIGAHPEDYTLFRIGTYDDGTAKIEPETPEALGVGVVFKIQRLPEKGNSNENP